MELAAWRNWEHYGHHTGNLRCANCMVHSGYEATAVNDTFGTLGGFLRTVKLTIFGGLGEGYLERPAPVSTMNGSSTDCNGNRGNRNANNGAHTCGCGAGATGSCANKKVELASAGK